MGVVALVTYLVSMLLPTIPGRHGVSGWEAFAIAFAGAAEGEPLLVLGAAANVLFILAVGGALLAPHRDGVPPRWPRALAAAALAASIVPAVVLPSLLLRPGWWAWAGSFALGRTFGPPWRLSARSALPAVARYALGPGVGGLAGECGRAAVIAAPCAALLSGLLVPSADDWAPAGLLVPPAVAIVASVSGGAFVSALALRFWRSRPAPAQRRRAGSPRTTSESRSTSGARGPSPASSRA